MNHLWILAPVAVLAGSLMIVYPGGFTPDSLYMYEQATGIKELTDIKPVFPILLMRAAVALIGDGGYVILNSFLYLIGTYLVATSLFKSAWARLLSSLFLTAFPPLLLINLSNWIDTAELSGLSVSVGCILAYIYRGHKVGFLWCAGIFSVWALISRHNAPATLLLIQILIVQLLCADRAKKEFARAAIFFGSLVFFLLSNSINPLTNRLMSVQHVPVLDHIYVYDLISISILEQRNLIPRELLSETLRDRSDEEIAAYLENRFGRFNSHNWGWEDVVEGDGDQDLTHMGYAIMTALNHPGYLLVSRYHTNKAWLSQASVAFTIGINNSRASELGLTNQNPTLYLTKFQKAAEYLRVETPLFQAGWYLMATALLLFSSVLVKTLFPAFRKFGTERRLIIVFCSSGMLTWLSLLPFMVTAEFRYLIPMLFLLFVSVLIVVGGVAKAFKGSYEVTQPSHSPMGTAVSSAELCSKIPIR